MERELVEITDVRDVGPNSIALVLKTPSAFDAQPGQFVKLVTTADGDEESRFYTISSPDVADSFELTIEIDPEGAVSPILEELQPGDTVMLSGPYGNAFYENESAVLVLAGGPGIGPAVGIGERAIRDGGTAAIVYQDSEPIHRDRLEGLAAEGVSVTIIDDDESLRESVPVVAAEERQVFVYGFADFLADAMDAIAAAGGKPDQAKVENFG